MIKSIWELKQEYRNQDFYIMNHSTASDETAELLFEAAELNLNLKAFADSDDSRRKMYATQTPDRYALKPVKDISRILKEAQGEAFLLNRQLHDFQVGLLKLVTTEEIVCLNSGLAQAEKVAIYGTGVSGKRMLQVLSEAFGEKGLPQIYFVDSKVKAGENSYFEGYRVLSPQELRQYDNIPVIIASVFYDQIYDNLLKLDISNVYIDYAMVRRKLKENAGFSPGYFSSSIEMIATRDVILCSEQNYVCIQMVGRLLKYLGMNIIKWMDYGPGKENREVYDFLYYGKERVTAIVESYAGECSEKLRSIGFSMEDNSIFPMEHTGIRNKRKFRIDALLGYYADTCQGDLGYCKFRFGQPSKDSYKIVILGGSTTESGRACFQSWPEAFYKLAQRAERDVVVYNMALSGYNVQQELLCAVRDIPALAPDLVLSFSGVNNIKNSRSKVQHPFCDIYSERVFAELEKMKQAQDPAYRINYGVPEELNDAELWIRCQKMMHAVCKSFGASHMTFLQPLITEKDCYSQRELFYAVLARTEYVENATLFLREARKWIKEYDWLIDAGDILKHAYGVFLDIEHVDGKGNQFIAEYVWDCVKDKIPKKMQGGG